MWRGGSLGSFGSSGTPLADFLPGATEEANEQRSMNLKSMFLPTALVARVNRWLAQEAADRLSITPHP